MFRKKAIASLVIVMAGTAGAQASTVNFDGLGYHSTVKFIYNGDNMLTPAGEILIDFNNANLTAYCVDIDHAIVPTWDANIAPVTDVNGGMAIAFLYDTFHAAVTDNVKAAALQVAIWEVLTDFGGLDLNSGDFELLTTGDILTTAENYLSALPADLSGYQTPAYLVKSTDYPRSQHLIVPEPATIAFLALFAPLMLVNWRSHRRTLARAA